ncbi:MAG: alpha-glucosidase [Anaerolineae bacterium]|jgi:alpha-glucosidase|nr:alpha-glucosidase [Anaerolineae bacterium]
MKQHHWWETAVFYQIYPRSFADGNGDGIGDFKGMISKLDYLSSLGIDAVWLSPHYPSPQLDVGYDISNYTDVNPEYGTLDEFKTFLNGLHERGIKLILDLVLNHTSWEHPWFLASKSSKDDPKRNWYIWQDGKGDQPPNNWVSTFGGSAWEYDETTRQYYYHFFFNNQPDLNWRNPEVKQAMFDAVRFWLDLGVDGFRLDAIGTIFEDPDLPDHKSPLSPEELYAKLAPFFFGTATPEMVAEQEAIEEGFDLLHEYQVNQPGVHELMRELRSVIDEYDDRMLVGETQEPSYYGNGKNELHQTFNFHLLSSEKLTPQILIDNQNRRLGECPEGCWPANTFNNHDGTRLISRFGDDNNARQLSRVYAALLLTLKGTPYLFNGEEIAMSNYVLEDVSFIRDNVALFYKSLMEKGLGMSPEEAGKVCGRLSRDVCRTPMQWRNGPNAGFSPEGITTWLPANPNYAHGINVAEQEDDPESHLNFYRQLIALRKDTPALQIGDYTAIGQQQKDTFAFLRMLDGVTVMVVLNFNEKTQTVDFSQLAKQAKTLYSSNGNNGETLSLDKVTLEPFGILITELLT